MIAQHTPTQQFPLELQRRSLPPPARPMVSRHGDVVMDVTVRYGGVTYLVCVTFGPETPPESAEVWVYPEPPRDRMGHVVLKAAHTCDLWSYIGSERWHGGHLYARAGDYLRVYGLGQMQGASEDVEVTSGSTDLC